MTDPILVTDADPAEWEDYDRIKVTDGVELSKESVATTEHIERTNESPCTRIDTPWPNEAWRGVAEIIREQIRATVFPELRESRGWAMFFCLELHKSGVEGRRPAHEQFTFCDMMMATSRDGRVDREASRCLKDAIYKWQNREYLARNVG